MISKELQIPKLNSILKVEINKNSLISLDHSGLPLFYRLNDKNIYENSNINLVDVVENNGKVHVADIFQTKAEIFIKLKNLSNKKFGWVCWAVFLNTGDIWYPLIGPYNIIQS